MARASNLMIGSTTLAVIAVAFIGGLGIQKYRLIHQQTPLRVVFEGSASGLRKGGSVNFDGVQIGEITSLKLDNPRKVIALTLVDKSAPILKDTIVGLEFQGLTGIAAIALTGGTANAEPVSPDNDGIPTLTADLSETESIRDTLHNVDRILVNNRTTMKEGLENFETYTAGLAAQGDDIDRIMGKAENAFGGFDKTIAKIDGVLPGLASGKNGELYKKIKSIRELADSFRKTSANVMEEGRRTLLDISQSAGRVDQKFEQPGAPAASRRRP
jgi:phospholipid/cholesterol/gamma-HCH transport system substrate-binding protein